MGYPGDDLLLADHAELEKSVPDRLHVILKQLTPWTAPLKTARDSFNLAMKVDDDVNIFQQPLNNGNETQTALAQTFLTLYTASHSLHLGHTLNIKTNVLLLAFMINWHIKVGCTMLF